MKELDDMTDQELIDYLDRIDPPPPKWLLAIFVFAVAYLIFCLGYLMVCVVKLVIF